MSSWQTAQPGYNPWSEGHFLQDDVYQSDSLLEHTQLPIPDDQCTYQPPCNKKAKLALEYKKSTRCANPYCASFGAGRLIMPRHFVTTCVQKLKLQMTTRTEQHIPKSEEVKVPGFDSWYDADSIGPLEKFTGTDEMSDARKNTCVVQ